MCGWAGRAWRAGGQAGRRAGGQANGSGWMDWGVRSSGTGHTALSVPARLHCCSAPSPWLCWRHLQRRQALLLPPTKARPSRSRAAPAPPLPLPPLRRPPRQQLQRYTTNRQCLAVRATRPLQTAAQSRQRQQQRQASPTRVMRRPLQLLEPQASHSQPRPPPPARCSPSRCRSTAPWQAGSALSSPASPPPSACSCASSAARPAAAREAAIAEAAAAEATSAAATAASLCLVLQSRQLLPRPVEAALEMMAERGTVPLPISLHLLAQLQPGEQALLSSSYQARSRRRQRTRRQLQPAAGATPRTALMLLVWTATNRWRRRHPT